MDMVVETTLLKRRDIGPPVLQNTFRQEVFNDSSTTVASPKVTFNQAITNTVTATKIRSNNFEFGTSVTFGGSAGFLGTEGSWETEVSFMYSYGREQQDSVSQEITGSISNEALITVLPNTRVETILEVFATPVNYSIKGITYLDSTVTIKLTDTDGTEKKRTS
ncbi:hypothetical protein [Bacillus mycoides]